MELIKNIVKKYPRLLPFILPIAWILILFPLFRFLPNLICINFLQTLILYFLPYVLLLLPSWICLFISEKKNIMLQQ